MRIPSTITAAVVSFLCAAAVLHAEPFYLGAYGTPVGPLVIVNRWDEDLYLLDMRDGLARRLEQRDGHEFVYGPTRSQVEPEAGRLRFELTAEGNSSQLVMAPAGRLAKIDLELVPVEFDNGTEANLAGTLVRPATPPRAWILYLAGEGPNTRWSVFDVAAWLGAHGIGSLIIDQRGVGGSTGEPVAGNYHARSLAAAGDAVAAMRFLMARPEVQGLPVGVGGHSQGGWIAAIVAREVKGTAFYVNLAGNGSPGGEQWRHAMTCWLHRKRVPLEQMAEAAVYFEALFGLFGGGIGWDEYDAARNRARRQEWWPVMKQRYTAEVESLAEAQSYARSEAGNVPANDFRQVRAPTLGLFFEHDHSTTPETPHHFLEALVAGGNGDVAVRVFPRGDHGAWVVDGYRMDRSRITHRLTAPYELMRDWILAIARREHRAD